MCKTIQYEDWKIWNGGNMPVPSETKVQVQLDSWDRERATGISPCPARNFDWEHPCSSGEIIAYREVKRPVVKEIALYGIKKSDGDWIFAAERYPSDNYEITMTEIDGVLQPDAKVTAIEPG